MCASVCICSAHTTRTAVRKTDAIQCVSQGGGMLFVAIMTILTIMTIMIIMKIMMIIISPNSPLMATNNPLIAP